MPRWLAPARAGLAALLIGLGAGIVIGGSGDPTTTDEYAQIVAERDEARSRATESAAEAARLQSQVDVFEAADAAAQAAEDAAALAAANAPNVEPGHLAIELRVTDKKCFGSAGCNVTVEPTLSIVANNDGVGRGGFRVTYEIQGGEDGPVVNTTDVTAGGNYTVSPERVSTARESDVLTAVITDVYYR
ncbi:hypothetical protein [Xylanimonas protaetiae]|uniref:Uncharacterized protein n=1 Tax=Xylanimonas protaetiae TaxID=2509457 RepID=A0A4P6F0D0_9MICO|nr:hypothetical protein [Xylanimonas protaetiae]QAY68636.1 hypothetical protein ET471_00055 [Xylanimonas protaetiae]